MAHRSPRPKNQDTALVWLRDDLRLGDNPALWAAARSGKPLTVLFILDEESPGLRPLGGASKWWLAHSLRSVGADIERLGGTLQIFTGAAEAIVPRLAAETAASSVFWNRRYLEAEIAVDRKTQDCLERDGVRVETFAGTLGHEPWDVVPKTGGFYRIYTPYWRAASGPLSLDAPLPAPDKLQSAGPPSTGLRQQSVEDLGLLPRDPDWAGGLRDLWQPGESQANRKLKGFVAKELDRYGHDRDSPALSGSSQLSPHLRFGEVSSRQVVAAVRQAAEDSGGQTQSAKFLQEIAWRDFSYNLLYHIPELPVRPFNPRFESFPFAKLPQRTLRAWQHGTTGYPFVDAGMRQLWRTGTMHNRARMVTASFLVKHLLADWRIGEAWFWDTLCDADPANNAVNWQWVAGTGPDAAPFFRIFNPVLQSRKFDPDGDYIRRFVPELATLDSRWIHAPWEAPPTVLAEAGVELGTTYPGPIVDHAQARAGALDAYASWRKSSERAVP